VNNVK